MIVVMMNGGDPEQVGLIPAWLDETDPRPAREQLDEHYQHGGGWQPFEGFKIVAGAAIKYPGDPVLKPRALMRMRDEVITVYDCGWVMILQRDGSFEISRMD